METIASPAGLLEPLADDLGLECSALFSSDQDLIESDSKVSSIRSNSLGCSVMLKEQLIGERGPQVRVLLH